MGLLGILSLLQIWIIPGILITAQFKRLSQYDRTLLVLPFSCLANYFLVITLTLSSIYNQTSLIVILIAEVVVLLMYAHNKMLQGRYGIDLSVLVGSEKNQNSIIRWSVILLIFFFSMLTMKQVGTVFTYADVLVGWNRFAIDWFHGILPKNTYHYPQLLASLYSLTYQFVGSNEIQLFAKLVPAVFPLMIMLTFLRVASLNKQNSTLYLLALILFWFIFSRMMGSTSAFSGYADVPLVYFVVVTMYIFTLARIAPELEQPKLNLFFLVLCAVVVAGASITKHSGLYIAAIMPMAWYFYFRNATNLRQIVTAYLVILVIAGSWFIYKQTQIYLGGDVSIMQETIEVVDLPWSEKPWHGLVMISSKLSWLWVPLFIAGLFTPLGRAHAIWIFIPFTLLWALFVSYDYRNLIIALPSLAFILASGMMKLHGYFNKTSLSTRIYRGVAKSVLLIFLATIIYMLSSQKLTTELIAINQAAKHGIGEREFNERLYTFFQLHPEPAMIASRYYGLSYLPELKERDLPASCSELELFADNHIARYLIVEAHCPELVLAKLSSKYKKLLEGKDLIFYEVEPVNMTK